MANLPPVKKNMGTAFLPKRILRNDERILQGVFQLFTIHCTRKSAGKIKIRNCKCMGNLHQAASPVTPLIPYAPHPGIPGKRVPKPLAAFFSFRRAGSQPARILPFPGRPRPTAPSLRSDATPVNRTAGFGKGIRQGNAGTGKTPAEQEKNYRAVHDR
ncbi:MAG: hypothetical protein LUE13_00640 [Akkermansiaceae bacterium]|nr:hypothetical protein [Akkermansiaceae bacterium]